MKKREEALGAREEELKARLQDLDDRSSRHARRQLRQDLKAALAQRTSSFTLSRDTSRKRLPIHTLFGLLVGGTGLLFVAAVIGHLPSAASLPAWVLVVRFSIVALAFAASVVFYIRWSDEWFRQHADEEMRLKRLELDIDRASWVVEMALEWRDEKGGEIPHELVERLSRNLFESEASVQVRHPSEDMLASLLGASAGLTVRLPNVGEATLDRKGIAKLKETVEKRP